MSYHRPEGSYPSEILAPSDEAEQLYARIGDLIDQVSTGNLPEGWAGGAENVRGHTVMQVRLQQGDRTGAHVTVIASIDMDTSRSLRAYKALPREDRDATYVFGKHISLTPDGRGAFFTFEGEENRHGTLVTSSEGELQAVTPQEAQGILDNMPLVSESAVPLQRHYGHFGNFLLRYLK